MLSKTDADLCVFTQAKFVADTIPNTEGDLSIMSPIQIRPHAAFTPIILAGGSGTRFWPRSRRSHAKQVLALDGDRTMIQQTVDRLLPLASLENMWVIANDGLSEAIRSQLPQLTKARLLCEPAARNTAPACGLAAFLACREDPETVLGIFPSDHAVRDTPEFVRVLNEGVHLSKEPGRIVVLGIVPSHAETGYGYIELGGPSPTRKTGARVVHSFTEKPNLATAREMVASHRFAWNSGIVVLRAQTLCDALYEHAPHIAAPLEAIAATYATDQFDATLAALYPACQNISIDYAVLEPRSQKGEHANIHCLSADFGWNDLGSWSALHQHRRSLADADAHNNVLESPAASTIHSDGNYVYAPGKHVALLGVQNLVVVLTEDAVLVTTQDQSQEVGKLVQSLREQGQTQLL